VAATIESQFNSVMGKGFALETLPDAGFNQEVYCALFEQASADALFNIFSAARFDNDGFDSLQVQKMSEDQSCGARPDDADLRAHGFPFAFGNVCRNYAQFRHTGHTLSTMRMGNENSCETMREKG
jgi:hypothetical protein